MVETVYSLRSDRTSPKSQPFPSTEVCFPQDIYKPLHIKALGVQRSLPPSCAALRGSIFPSSKVALNKTVCRKHLDVWLTLVIIITIIIIIAIELDLKLNDYLILSEIYLNQ